MKYAQRIGILVLAFGFALTVFAPSVLAETKQDLQAQLQALLQQMQNLRDQIAQENRCLQVITPAQNSSTGECKEFSTPCEVPFGWAKVNSCPVRATITSGLCTRLSSVYGETFVDVDAGSISISGRDYVINSATGVTAGANQTMNFYAYVPEGKSTGWIGTALAGSREAASFQSEGVLIASVQSGPNPTDPSSQYGGVIKSITSYALRCANYMRPSLTIFSPKGGEIWKAGETHTIKWRATGITTIDKLSLCGISNYLGEICTSEAVNLPASTGNYQWRLDPNHPYFPGANLWIRFTVENKQWDSQRFSVVEELPKNSPPVIHSLKGPTSLKVGEVGTWTIQASDPEGGSLAYRIVWGDEPISALSFPENEPFAQTATLTHSYATAGKFIPKITVLDSQGLSAKASVSVEVKPAVRKPIVFFSPKGGEKWSVGQTVSLNWTPEETVDMLGLLEVKTKRQIPLDSLVKPPFPWIVSLSPDLKPGTYRLGVTRGDKTDYSNPFTILAPSVTVLSPNGGEEWLFGRTYNITWKAQDVKKAYIHLSSPEGGICKLAEASAEKETLRVKFTKGQKCSGSTSVIGEGKYKILITTDNPAVKDESDNLFNLLVPAVGSSSWNSLVGKVGELFR